MIFPRPFAGVDAATRRLRLVLLGATLLGMVCCLPLWLSTRAYPLAPLLAGFPNLPGPLDSVFLALTLLSLIGACWRYRPCVSCFLAAMLFLYFGDLNRGQPWLYLYWMLLLASLWPGERAGAAMRVVISVSYIWAGLQKLNPVFFQAIPAWFVQPLEHWGGPGWLVACMRGAVATAPLLEIAIGVGVWFAPMRRATLAAVIGLHTVSLLLLGPWGHNVNLVVWPWNLAMIALMVVLFSRPASLPLTWRALLPAPGLLTALGLFGLLPGLSYWGWWDSYFSFSLYSANTARADIYMSAQYRARLPLEMQRFAEPVENFDPSFQKPFVFAHLKWAVAELGVPGVPEPGAFMAVFRAVSRNAHDQNDCHMIVGTRTGRVRLFVPGDASPKVIAP